MAASKSAQNAFSARERIPEAAAAASERGEHVTAFTEANRALAGCRPRPGKADFCLDLLLFVAEQASASGDLKRGEALAQSGLELAWSAVGQRTAEEAAALLQLGSTFFAQGRREEAASLSRRALAIYLEVGGENRIETAGAYRHVGDSFLADGDSVEAERYFRRGLKIMRRASPGDDSRISIYLSSIASSLQHRGLLVESEPYFRAALALERRHRGERHPETATSHANLATCLMNLGRRAEADRHYRHALSILTRNIGSNSLAVAITLNNMGYNRQAQRAFRDAEYLFRLALVFATRQPIDTLPLLIDQRLTLATLRHNRFDPVDAYQIRAVALSGIQRRGQQTSAARIADDPRTMRHAFIAQIQSAWFAASFRNRPTGP